VTALQASVGFGY